ncbi:TolC family protein [Leptospira koniambonensis]|nr:TolC family protein [Leptospira koniambonensis]
MRYSYILVFISLFWILFFPVKASEDDQKKELNLNSIMAIAEKNSPLLTAINSDLESLFYKRRQEGKTQNPSVYVDYGQRKAADESGAEYAVQIEQPIYFPGRKELKQLLVDNDSKIKEIQQIEAYNSIRLSSIKFAYRYLVAADKKNHVKERLKRLSLIENYIKARPFFTPQAKTDLFIIETKILALRKHFNDLELGAAKDYESLNLYLRQESMPPLKIPYFRGGVKFDRQDLEKKAVSQNPSILAAKGELNKARTELRLANLEKYPDYSITSQIGEDKSGVANRFYDFGLKFRIPVWDQFQNKVASAETNMKSKQDRLIYQENLIQTSFNQSYLEYEQSKVNLKLYDLAQLDRIDRDLNFADMEFKRGRIQLISYLELENQLHETHHAVLDAQISHLESLLNLLYITNEKDILGVMGNASQTFEYQPK